MKSMIDCLSDYRRVIENVPSEDGGGFRVFYPTLGYSAYGVGDTLEVAMISLQESLEALERFIVDIPGYKLPKPTIDDLKDRLQRVTAASETSAENGYAYAA